MTVEISYLSYSSINLYLTCPEAWRRRYIAKEHSPSTPALFFGSALHNTIEKYIADRADKVEGHSLTDLWPMFWNEERQSDVEWAADTPEQHFNEGIRLLSNPELIQVLNRLTPLRDDQGLFMEREVFLRIPGVPIPIKGYIDIVTNDGVPGDFKTSAFAWTADKAREELQPLFYLAAMNQLGRNVPGLRFRHFVITKAKQSKVQVIETQHTYDAIFWLYELVQKVWRGIEAEVFTPNPHAWLCKPQFCQAWSKCRGRGM